MFSQVPLLVFRIFSDVKYALDFFKLIEKQQLGVTGSGQAKYALPATADIESEEDLFQAFKVRNKNCNPKILP